METTQAYLSGFLPAPLPNSMDWWTAPVPYLPVLSSTQAPQALGSLRSLRNRSKCNIVSTFSRWNFRTPLPGEVSKYHFPFCFKPIFFFFGNVRISHRTGIAASGQCSSVPTAQQAVTLDTSKVCSAWEPAEWVSFSTEEQDSTAQNSPSVKHGVTNFAVVKRGNLLQN